MSGSTSMNVASSRPLARQIGIYTVVLELVRQGYSVSFPAPLEVDRYLYGIEALEELE